MADYSEAKVQYDREDMERARVKSVGRENRRDEYSMSAQLEAWATEVAMLQDMISQLEKKLSPLLVDDDMVASEGGERGMDRRMNSPLIETIISNREFLRGQTQRLMSLVERAQI